MYSILKRIYYTFDDRITITIRILLFTVYRLGGRSHIRVQSGERSEFQRRVRVLHENGPLPQLRRDTFDLGRHTG